MNIQQMESNIKCQRSVPSLNWKRLKLFTEHLFVLHKNEINITTRVPIRIMPIIFFSLLTRFFCGGGAELMSLLSGYFLAFNVKLFFIFLI